MKLDDIGIRLDQISTQLKVLKVRTEGVSRMSGDVRIVPPQNACTIPSQNRRTCNSRRFLPLTLRSVS